ncbi:dUTP diphosphatase [Ceraceosorus guamensis]|uniref:Deoxyuridine 5'-triphosphate nucleotidohydrolase n=1 Tax=Ceraceosorus guamensis TaxID=1522189 RepID=A0A316VST9_9BASI|nr:dUTP diphosphatase [Ceraceosorus guamensis]PWN40699.1 dUTP diphosphatase [Ceraceosorus guamensis]
MPLRPASPLAASSLPPSKVLKMSTTTAPSTSKLLVQLDAAHPGAKLPTRGSAFAAGYDLYASQGSVLKARARGIVPTGIRLAIPEGCYGRVAPRSGLASKHGIDVGAGVIDSDYRGLLGVLLFNLSEEDFTINEGDRIAQLVIERIATPEVEQVADLDATVRGAGGFGSTGGFGKNSAAPEAPAKDPEGVIVS